MCPFLLPILVLALRAAPSDAVVSPIREPIRAWSAHYAAVVDELRAADTSGLSDVQRAARRQMIDALCAYRERADFGRGTEVGARLPYFVDDEGRPTCTSRLTMAVLAPRD